MAIKHSIAQRKKWVGFKKKIPKEDISKAMAEKARNRWLSMTPAERKASIRKMVAGRKLIKK